MSEKESLFDEFETGEEAPAEESGFTRFLRKLPGVGSYIDKNNLRENDQTLRNAVSEQLSAARLELSAVLTALSKDIIKAMDFAEKIGRIDTRLIGLASKIKAAPVGYTGLLAKSKIDEQALAQINTFDEQLFDHADLITSSVAALQKAVKLDGDINMALSDLDTAIIKTQAVFETRNELLSGTAS